MFFTLFDPERLIILPSISSTNDYLWDLVEQSPPEGTLVQALEQTKGRGQKGNSWSSEMGENLLISILLYPTWIPPHRLFDLSIMTSVSLVNTLNTWLENEIVRIKWPNDIVVNGKKICGILIENQIEGHRVKASILGIGINVNQTVFSEEKAPHAVSIKHYIKEALLLEDIRDTLLTHLNKAYFLLKNGKQKELKDTYLSYLLGYKQYCRLKWKDRVVNAFVNGVDENGKLIAGIDDLTYTFDIKEVSWWGI